SLVYLILLHQTPKSPLFPYTTLFRSLQSILFREAFRLVSLHDVIPGVFVLLYTIKDLPRLDTSYPWTAFIAVRRISCENLGVEVDRKSTRLNSSHVKISYAVFCLNKN